jgi:hypothetical protein
MSATRTARLLCTSSTDKGMVAVNIAALPRHHACSCATVLLPYTQWLAAVISYAMLLNSQLCYAMLEAAVLAYSPQFDILTVSHMCFT